MSTVFLGDGTLGEGVTYESLNIASLWTLPVLFVVENNHYAQSTPVEPRARRLDPGPRSGLRRRGGSARHDRRGGGSPGSRRGRLRIRETGAPFFLVLDTYRFSPHSKGDDNRDPAEIEERRKRDPVLVAGARLDEDERRAIEEAREKRLAEVVEAASRAGGDPEAA